MKRVLALGLVMALGVLVLGTTRPAQAQSVVQVLDYNIYLGADLTPITGAPDLISAAVAAGQAFDSIRFKTDYGARVKAIADIIATEDPDVVGLQEVITYFIQDPSDGGGPSQGGTPADTLFQDFLTLLVDELKSAHGDNYDVACRNFNADTELPVIASGMPSFLTDVRLVDSDVILLRDGISTAQEQLFSCNPGTFATQLCVPLPGCTTCCGGGSCVGVPECIEFTRGFSTVDATIRGNDYLIANTHLEVQGGGAAIQSAQASELDAAITAAGGGPAGIDTIVTGDFNSEVGDAGFGTDTFIAAGYNDTWLLNRRIQTQPETCCHDSTLDNATDAVVDERIDYVFTSYVPSDVLSTVQGRFQDQRTGAVGGVCSGSLPVLPPDPGVRCNSDQFCDDAGLGICRFGTPDGLWPADHSAVSARIRR